MKSVVPPQPSVALVTEFHEKFGHPIADAPTVGSLDLRMLRAHLILEEAIEFCEAAGLRVDVQYRPSHSGAAHRITITVDPHRPPNMVGMADALGDSDYVVSGANLAFGFPAVAIMAEIHRSNMSKLGADGRPIYRQDGKVLKGPNYTPPNIAALLGVEED